MEVRALFTRLGFRTDMSGAAGYDAALRGMQNRAQAVSTAIGTTLGVLAANVITNLALAVGSATAALPRAIIEGGDALTGSMNAIEGAVRRTGESGAAIYQQIRAGALETGVAVQDTAQAFQRFAPAFQDMNRPAADAVTLLTNLQKGFAAANSSTAETTGAMRQIGQSFASMNLQLGEFNSFNEQAGPDMVRAFAEATGNTMSTIRKAIEEGKITPELMVRGFEAAGRAGADAFERATPTVKRSMSQMRVAMSLFFGEMDATFGISQRVARGLLQLKAAFMWMEGRVIALRALIDSFGGLREVLIRVALAVATLTLAWAAFNFTAATGMVMGLARSLWVVVAAANAVAMRFAVAALAVTGIFLAMEDLYSFLQGKDTLLSRALGMRGPEFIEGLSGRLRGLASDLGAALAGEQGRTGVLWFLDETQRAIQRLIEFLPQLKAAFEATLFGGSYGAGASVREFLTGLAARVAAPIQGAAEAGAQVGRLSPGAVLPGPRSTIVTQQNTFNVTATATTANENTLAQSMGRAVAGALTGPLGGLAQQISVSIPPAEARAQ